MQRENYFMLQRENDACTVNADDASKLLFEDTVYDLTYIVEHCAKKCFDYYGTAFRFGKGDNYGMCSCYNAECTQGATDELWDYYTVESPCYWSTPTMVYENSLCKNQNLLMGATVVEDTKAYG
jgi:hypothetical protein